MENITSIVSLIRADCGTRADCRLMDTDSQKHIRDSFHFHDARIHNTRKGWCPRTGGGQRLMIRIAFKTPFLCVT